MKNTKNFINMFAFLIALTMLLGVTPTSVPANTSHPNVSGISVLPADFARNPLITMNGTTVSAMRYSVMVDGVQYDAYCADQQLRGPESAGAVYELSG